MNLIRAIVLNPVKVTVGVLLVSLFGVVSLLRMPLQLTPEVNRPTISVQTRWPGASPQEVEREIIIEQEEQLKSVEGLVKLSSEATDSQGTVTLMTVPSTRSRSSLHVKRSVRLASPSTMDVIVGGS